MTAYRPRHRSGSGIPGWGPVRAAGTLTSMSTGYWSQVQATGFAVPSDRPLDDLTAELTTMLGSRSPEVRDGTAFPALATWIGRGVYDDLLAGLGDGMVAGLSVGLGETDTDSVFRRSFSALILAACLERDNDQHLLPGGKILEWGDRAATWFLARARHPRLRAGKGWAHAVAHGADTIGALGAVAAPGRRPSTPCCSTSSPSASSLQPADAPLVARRGRPDRGRASMAVLRRNTLGTDVLEPWVHRLAAAGTRSAVRTTSDPYAPAAARAGAPPRPLPPALARRPQPPPCGSDLLLVVIDALRMTNASLPASSGCANLGACSARDLRPRRRAGRRRRPRPRRRDDVHPLRRARLPDVRRRGQGGRPADAPARRAPRADGRLRRRGDRQADPRARARGAHRRPGRHQRRSAPSRRRSSTARRWSSSAAAPRRTAGAPAASRSSTSRRSSRRSPSSPAPSDDRRRGRRRHGRGLHARPAPRTAARSSSTSRWTSSSTPPPAPCRVGRAAPASSPTPTRSTRIARLLAAAQRPGADPRHRRVGRPRRGGRAALRRGPSGIPTITNGMGRGIVPGGHPLLVTKARGAPRSAAPTSSSSSAPRWTSGSATASSAARTEPRRRRPVVHIADSPGQVSGHAELAASVAGDLTSVLDGLQAAIERGDSPTGRAWVRPSSPTRCGRGRRARRRAAHRRGRPDPPGAHLRRAGPAARRRRGRHRRRRRLRLLRRQVRRAEAPRRLARPRPLRLPRRRPRRRDRRPARAAVGPGRAAARRRRRRLLADGRRHPGPPRPAGRDGHGQQLRVGPGEGPDADALRLRRGRRPRPADAVRRGGAGPRRRRRDRDRPAADRPGPGPRLRLRRPLPRQRRSPTSRPPTRAARFGI